eukprot:TCONS_00054835-protein
MAFYWTFFLAIIGASAYVYPRSKSTDNLCSQQYFMSNFVKDSSNLNDTHYNRLKNCSNPLKQCTSYAGNFSITYAEDRKKRYLIMLKVENILNQGCWGYAMRINDSLRTETEYFNTDGSTKDFQAYYYIKLGFTYEFLLTPLPTGKPLRIQTTSPSLCEMGVLEIITTRLTNGGLFNNCKHLPGFLERQEVAKQICNKYPNDIIKRTQAARRNLVEHNCKFELNFKSIFSLK